LCADLANAFIQGTEKEGLTIVEDGQLPEDLEAPYLRVEHPDGTVQVFSQPKQQERYEPKLFNVQIGRYVMPFVSSIWNT
jgi:hypothetical protein